MYVCGSLGDLHTEQVGVRAGQPIKAGAVIVEGLQHGDAPGPCLKQRGLRRHDVVVGEAAPPEAIAHKVYGPLRLGERFLHDPSSLAGLGGELDL
jgi:hypothetical protein